MATTDVFNNSANNYVNPNLSPCAGAGDDSYLEFLPNDTIGVVQGGNTLASISFSDIKIPVSAYNSQKKVLEPGEVAFITGLTKGLSYRSQSFILPFFDTSSAELEPYFMTIDLSVGFYKNFGYKLYNLEASANYSNNISIVDALNVAFSNLQAKITCSYDPSDLTFIGSQAGWDFNISNVELTLIDTSENALSPFRNLGDPQNIELEEDLSKMVLYAKYPNSAMQGIILKATYPSEESPYDKWFQINHAPDIVTIYEPIQINNFITNLQKTAEITFDPSIVFGPFITSFGDASNGIDVSDGSQSYVLAVDSSFATYDLADSSLYNSRLNLSSTALRTVIENSYINKDYPLLPYGDPSSRVEITLSLLNDCSVYNALISDTSIFKTLLMDVSLFNCTLYNCTYDPSLVKFENCTIIRINESIDCSISYDLDSSLYYTPTIKTIEVGMSGCSTSTAMSAGDYLEWITENDAWEKVGDMYIWTSAPDAEDTKNLIPGFYVFNPQLFNIQLEYLTFV
jgi:hypothetical protein